MAVPLVLLSRLSATPPKPATDLPKLPNNEHVHENLAIRLPPLHCLGVNPLDLLPRQTILRDYGKSRLLATFVPATNPCPTDVTLPGLTRPVELTWNLCMLLLYRRVKHLVRTPRMWLSLAPTLYTADSW